MIVAHQEAVVVVVVPTITVGEAHLKQLIVELLALEAAKT